MKRIVIIICILFSYLDVPGQEKILEVQNLGDITSIVRDAGDDLWLVCNNSYGQTRFSLVDEYWTFTPQLQLGYIEGTDSTRINDFEIFRDTVYFCGQTWREETSSAIWGFFPLTGFPYVTVCFEETDPYSFSRIDVFSVDTTTFDLHVVMLGVGHGSYPGSIYDAVRITPNYYAMYTSLVYEFTPNNLFYDVAVTDQHVAVSSSYSSGSILFINKPSTIATTIFSSSASNYFYNGPMADIMLEYCKNDALVAVARPLLSGDLTVLGFLGLNPSYHLGIIKTENRKAVDVKFDKVSEDLDILVRPYHFLSRSDSSEIYHLNQSLAANGGSVFCHKYMDEKLNSLEWLSSDIHSFVASGHNDGQNGILRLYKYRFDQWKECSLWTLKEAESLEII